MNVKTDRGGIKDQWKKRDRFFLMVLEYANRIITVITTIVATAIITIRHTI